MFPWHGQDSGEVGWTQRAQGRPAAWVPISPPQRLRSVYPSVPQVSLQGSARPWEPPARHSRGHCQPLGPGSDEALGGPSLGRPFSTPTLTPPQQHSSPEPEAGAAFCSPPLQVGWRVLGLACRALRGSLWTPHPSPCPRLAPAQHQPSQDTHHPFGQLHVDPLWSTACLPNPQRLCFTSEARGDPPFCPGCGRAASGGWREVRAPP